MRCFRPSGWALLLIQRVILLLVTAGVMAAIAPAAYAELTVRYISVTPEAAFTTNRVYAGTSTAARRAQLGFKRGGEVAMVAVDLGDTVTAGQLLAQLDTRGLESDLRRAQSERVLADANGNVSQQAFDEAF